MREEAAFFQATSTALAGSRSCSDKSREERDFAIQQIASAAPLSQSNSGIPLRRWE